MRDPRDLLPFVSRARFDRIWRENAELRNALKRANEQNRKLRLIVEDSRFPQATGARTSNSIQ